MALAKVRTAGTGTAGAHSSRYDHRANVKRAATKRRRRADRRTIRTRGED